MQQLQMMLDDHEGVRHPKLKGIYSISSIFATSNDGVHHPKLKEIYSRDSVVKESLRCTSSEIERGIQLVWFHLYYILGVHHPNLKGIYSTIDSLLGEEEVYIIRI